MRLKGATLRGDRAGRRRHPVDRARRRGRPARTGLLRAGAAARRCADRRGRRRPSKSSRATGSTCETELRMLRAARRDRRRCARSGCARAFSAPMPSRRNTAAAPTPTSTRSACPRWRPPTPRDWSMRWTASARASPSTPRRWRGCSTRRGRSACRSSCMPSSSRNLGGAALAARYGALSADHLEYADEAGVGRDGGRGHGGGDPAGRLLHPARDARCRRSTPSAPHGVPMAVATDCNPGSSPMTSLLLAMNMACTLFRMTPEEALAGVDRAMRRRRSGLTRQRHARAGHARRSRGLGCREPGRTCLPHRLQSACTNAFSEGALHDPLAHPRRNARWRRWKRSGAASARGPARHRSACRRSRRAAAIVAARGCGRRAGLRRQHRLRQARLVRDRRRRIPPRCSAT